MAKVLVIGAGIIGLCAARSLHADGHVVTVVDRDPSGDKASLGNAGGLAVTEILPASVPGLIWRIPRWLIDPLGPLTVRFRHLPALLPWLIRFVRSGSWREVERIAEALAPLAARTYEDTIPLLTDLGLEADLCRTGALWVYETRQGLASDGRFHDLRRQHGIVCEEMDAAAARDMEPALGDAVAAAVFTPQWSHVVAPERIVERLRKTLADRGASIVRAEAVAIDGDEVLSASGDRFGFDQLVVAAGAWSGRFANQVGDRVLLTSERGYNTTLPDPGVKVGRELIFAERQFVATPLESGLRIGGAAEFAGLAAPPDYRRSDALLALAGRYLPDISTAGGIRWMGQRPTTADTMPVLGRSPRRANVIYAFGHGHIGLTAGATTGCLVADLAGGRRPPIDIRPFGIERFQ